MWLQRLTNYLLAHRWQTIGLAFVLTFLPIIGILGVLVAALVTLRKGIFDGALLTLAVILPYFISFFISETSFVQMMWAGIGIAVLSNLITYAFAVMLYRKCSWSMILQVAALVGVLGISVIHLIFPNVAEWWGGQLQIFYTQAQAVTGALKAQGVSQPDLPMEAINATKQYATGFIIAGILFNGILQLIIGAWWQAVVYNPGSLKKALHNIRLSRLASILFALSLLLAYLGNSVVLDIMPVLYVLFGAAGLSLLHYMFGLMTPSAGWFWLTVFYILLIFSLPVSVIFVAMLALADAWIDLRLRFKKVN